MRMCMCVCVCVFVCVCAMGLQQSGILRRIASNGCGKGVRREEGGHLSRRRKRKNSEKEEGVRVFLKKGVASSL